VKALQDMDCPTAGTTARSSCRAPTRRPTSRRCRAPSTPRTAQIVYYLFDLPYCAGHDLRDVPLEQRRAVLQRIVERKPHPNVRFSEVFEAPPQDILASACRLGLEGVIAKRRDSPTSAAGPATGSSSSARTGRSS
jgi:ATP-dependent DNA ligase